MADYSRGQLGAVTGTEANVRRRSQVADGVAGSFPSEGQQQHFE